MLVADILHSCTDEGVAGAAVASIGGDFAATMRSEALRSGLTVGGLAVSLVSGFAIDASERDWRRLTARLVGEDHPVLSGLQAIAEQMLARRRIHLPVPRRERGVLPAGSRVSASLRTLS